MKSPFTGKEMILKKEIRTLTFRKEGYNVMYHFYVCEDSKEKFTDTELDGINLAQLYNQYREKHNLPFPDEIIAIREKYKLPAIKMAEILGFGVNVYRNYESGEVPNESNARLIQLAKDPRKFKELIEISKVYKEDEQKKLIKNIDDLIQREKNNILNLSIWDYLLGYTTKPGINTGYRVPSFEKLTEMVVYFTQEMQPWKTKLNKILFYADFLNFKKTCLSISGCQYRAIDMGPVPNNFNSIYEYLANKDYIDIFQTEFQNGNLGEQFKPNASKKFNPEIFTEEELKTLKEIVHRFSTVGTKEMIEISHNEKAWKENFTAGKHIISYDYGFELYAV